MYHYDEHNILYYLHNNVLLYQFICTYMKYYTIGLCLLHYFSLSSRIFNFFFYKFLLEELIFDHNIMYK